MRNLFSSFLQHPYVQTVRRWTSAVTTPLHSLWVALLSPLQPVLEPIRSGWARLTAGPRRFWAAFTARNPSLGTVGAIVGKLFWWGLYAVLALVLSVWVGVFGALPSSEELKNIESANATEIYTADSVLIGRFYIENRTTITLDKISPYVVTALLATEDKRFFDHSGIDLQSWFRVLYGVVARHESLGGGSTLSQQLAKNLYPRKNYRIPGLSIVINKIRENFISVRLERIYTKADLLNLYLNTVPFGGDRFGISVASRHFFNKKPKDLSPDQAATLIGMLKASTALDPVRNPDNAFKRRNLVLLQMVKNSSFQVSVHSTEAGMDQVRKMIENGRVNQKQYEELIKKPVGAKRYSRDGNNDGVAAYFREYLRTDIMPKLLKDLTKEDGSSYNLYTDGLKVYTTLHSKMQQYAEEAVHKQMQSLQEQFDTHWKNYKKEKPWGDDKWIDEQLRRSDRWSSLEEAGLSKEEILANFEKPTRMTIFSWEKGGPETDTTMSPIDSVRYYFCLLNCGFMAMDHHNGYVRAWVGGTNFKYFKYDHIKSSRQVGSTFKPIVYAAALQDSIRPCSYIPNQIVKIVDWEPHNSDETYGGWYSVLGGLTYSVNVVAAQLIEKVGIENTIQLARKMGVTSTLPREFGISLGAADISLYDMVKVYGTMANQGVRPDPVVVLRVTTRKGEKMYDYQDEQAKNPTPKEQALSPNQAATMTRMLQSVINSGTGARMRYGFGLYQGEFAGKTGTTQNQADGWFVCYNPDLVTGAWVGAESPAVRFRSMSLGQGSSMALPIVAWFWHKMANDRQFVKMYQARFPEPKPEVLAQFGCPLRIAISPDTLQMLLADTTIRDSLRSNGFKYLKETADKYFEQNGDPENPEDGDPNQKRGLFDRLFGRRQEEKPKENNNQQDQQ
ncbi:MAG: transglycosylase domain-containing protein [Saprospiraceae bacterium]|nr:transglycosylase domain-containing protein [Saprospiraceae bacterium]